MSDSLPINNPAQSSAETYFMNLKLKLLWGPAESLLLQEYKKQGGARNNLESLQQPKYNSVTVTLLTERVIHFQICETPH